MVVHFPSPFSYHIIQDITASHLMNFIKIAESRGIKIEFLNATEYSNITHALAIRTGIFLHEGEQLLWQAAISQDRFVYPRPDDSFFTALFGSIWSNLERLNIGEGFAEIPFVYLKNMEGNPRNQTVHSILIGVETIDGDEFNMYFAHNNLTSLLFPTSLSSPQSTIYSDALTYHVGYSLWNSFNLLLSHANLHGRNLEVTLYLKDLSHQSRIVSHLEDMDRINIGVLIENSDGTVSDLDWIVEQGLQVQATDNITNRVQIINAFHESAHELVRQALRSHVTVPESLSIMSGLMMRPLISNFTPSMGQHTYGVLSNPITNQDYIHFIAEKLAGAVAEVMLSDTFHLIELNDNPENMVLDSISTWNAVHEGICLHLSYNTRECTQPRSPVEWNEWKKQLPLFEQEAFDREQRAWILAANVLAREVLITHANIWVRLTRLLLQKGRLNTSTLQEFYGNAENTLNRALLRPLMSHIDRNSINGDLSLALEALEYLDSVDRYAPELGTMFTLSLEDVLNAFGVNDLWDNLEMDVFYRNLSMAFALDVDQNLDRVSRMSLQDVFDEVKRVDIPQEFLPYIQDNNRVSVEQMYSQGLPAIYFEYLVRAL